MTRILVADDDRPLVALVRTVLEGEGYAVETAGDGQEALERATESRPDLILLDLHMPVMDGWACCRSLKQEQITQHVPIILMSADGVGADVCADLGAQHFLHKPFEITDLLLSVEKFASCP